MLYIHWVPFWFFATGLCKSEVQSLEALHLAPEAYAAAQIPMPLNPELQLDPEI